MEYTQSEVAAAYPGDAAVRGHLERARDCWNAGDLDALVGHYAERAVLLIGVGLPIVGRAALRGVLVAGMRANRVLGPLRLSPLVRDSVGVWAWGRSEQGLGAHRDEREFGVLVVWERDRLQTLLEIWPLERRLTEAPRTSSG